jgi:hypothetical protein
MTSCRLIGFTLLAGCSMLMQQPAAAAGKPRPGERLQECRSCPELVVLRAG